MTKLPAVGAAPLHTSTASILLRPIHCIFSRVVHALPRADTGLEGRLLSALQVSGWATSRADIQTRLNQEV